MTDQERHAAEMRSIMKITGIIAPKKEKKAEKPVKKAKKEEK